MSDGAREAILGAIRAARRTPATTPGEIAREAERLAARGPASRPQRAGDRVERFVERATAPGVGASLERVAALAEVPAALGRYLAAHALPARIALAPALVEAGVDWSGFECRAAPERNESVAVNRATLGVAETGTLVFCSGPETPELLGFLPLHSVAVLEAARIVPWLEDCWLELRRTRPGWPRAVSWITGASGTSDIEATHVRGAHGPAHLHVILVGP